MAPQKKNQYKPLPSVEDLAPYIIEYWEESFTDKQILQRLKDKHIDLSTHGMGLSKFVQMREGMGLIRTRTQAHTKETVKDAVQELRHTFPKAGSRDMISLLFQEKAIRVSRNVMKDYFSTYELGLVRERKAGRLQRKRFWAAGVNDLLCIDQHDKWKKYGLCLHTGIEPFVGRIQWLKIWWTNSNPRLILSYHLDVIEAQGFMPLVTQSDPGSENYGVANGQSLLRQWHDPTLKGTSQHRWMRDKKNIPPEISWSQLRRRFTPGYENVIELGILEGWYDPADTLDCMVFRWVFIPYLQKELDKYRDRVNKTAKRADRNKVLPHGVPNDMYRNAEYYGALDFKVAVEPEAIDYVRALYAPKDHEVFHLVPPTFEVLATGFYIEMGSPATTRSNVWEVYLDLQRRFIALEAIPEQVEWHSSLTQAREEAEARDAGESIELLPNQEDLLEGQPLGEGYSYMGGVNGGLGLDENLNTQLNQMLNEDEPAVGDDGLDWGAHPPLVVDWFSDEEEEDVNQW